MDYKVCDSPPDAARLRDKIGVAKAANDAAQELQLVGNDKGDAGRVGNSNT